MFNERSCSGAGATDPQPLRPRPTQASNDGALRGSPEPPGTRDWTVQEWTNVLLVIFTGVYTIASLLLWFVTWRSLNVVKRQMSLAESVNRSETSYRISSAHRQIFLALLHNDKLLEVLAHEQGLVPNSFARLNGATVWRPSLKSANWSFA